jgi:hypothetical protein
VAGVKAVNSKVRYVLVKLIFGSMFLLGIVVVFVGPNEHLEFVSAFPLERSEQTFYFLDFCKHFDHFAQFSLPLADFTRGLLIEFGLCLEAAICSRN